MAQTRIQQMEMVKAEIDDCLRRLERLPELERTTEKNLIEQGKRLLERLPQETQPVYIHVIGIDKSYKTSYVLDLFDNTELRNLIPLPMATSSEHTGVPCLIEPDEKVDQLKIEKLSLDEQSPFTPDAVPRDQFTNLYLFDPKKVARTQRYMLRVYIPAKAVQFKLPVIDYPGMKRGPEEVKEQASLHEAFRTEMPLVLGKFPGIVVACFDRKVEIPYGHAMETILEKYRESLKANLRLPLVLSQQGAKAIETYCGDTKVLEDIKKDFQSYTLFDTTIQLVNPRHSDYPVHFREEGPYVDEWIQTLSQYGDLGEIKKEIERDGGIEWSRKFLSRLARKEHLREAITRVYMGPWINDSKKFLELANGEYIRIISRHKGVETQERIRELLRSAKYKTIRDCFKEEFKSEFESNDQTIQEQLWKRVIAEYLQQFFDKQIDCTGIAEDVWTELIKRLDPQHQGFLATRKKHAAHIILNIMEIYVPNALLRRDWVIYKGFKDETK